MQENKRMETYDDEITLKELILKIQEFAYEAWSKKFWIILTAGLFATIFLVKSLREPILYPAELTFMVDEDSGNALGGLSGMLGSIGLGAGGEYNYEKISTIQKSRRIVEKALLDTVNISGEQKILGDALLQYLKDEDLWRTKSGITYPLKKALKKLRNQKRNTISLNNFSFSNTQDSLVFNKGLQKMMNKIFDDKDPIVKLTFQEKSGIFHLVSSLKDQEVANLLTHKLYNSLQEYYVESATEKERSTYQILEKKTDSLENLISNKQYALAAFQDKQRNAWSNQSNLRKDQLRDEIRILQMAYGEAIKNREIASFSLQNSTPFLTHIDKPVLPLKSEEKSPFKKLLFGGFLGAFLSLIGVILKKIFVDVMKEH